MIKFSLDLYEDDIIGLYTLYSLRRNKNPIVQKELFHIRLTNTKFSQESCIENKVNQFLYFQLNAINP